MNLKISFVPTREKLTHLCENTPTIFFSLSCGAVTHKKKHKISNVKGHQQEKRQTVVYPNNAIVHNN